VTVERVEFHVEEPSMEAFLRGLLPRILTDVDFDVFVYQGKSDLRRSLPVRLRAQASWAPKTWRTVVLVDRDTEDCVALREELDAAARGAGLGIWAGPSSDWSVVNRIAIEELESWYFGDWEAVRAAYPGVPATIPHKEPFRDPDGVRGGTWEAFERILQGAGYFDGGLRKIEAAREISTHVDLDRNRSRSFAKLAEVLRSIRAVAHPPASGASR
jgi:hypothetical protein